MLYALIGLVVLLLLYAIAFDRLGRIVKNQKKLIALAEREEIERGKLLIAIRDLVRAQPPKTPMAKAPLAGEVFTAAIAADLRGAKKP